MKKRRLILSIASICCLIGVGTTAHAMTDSNKNNDTVDTTQLDVNCCAYRPDYSHWQKKGTNSNLYRVQLDDEQGSYCMNSRTVNSNGALRSNQHNTWTGQDLNHPMYSSAKAGWTYRIRCGDGTTIGTHNYTGTYENR